VEEKNELQCSECPNKYKTPTTLKRHLEKIHGISPEAGQSDEANESDEANNSDGIPLLSSRGSGTVVKQRTGRPNWTGNHLNVFQLPTLHAFPTMDSEAKHIGYERGRRLGFVCETFQRLVPLVPVPKVKANMALITGAPIDGDFIEMTADEYECTMVACSEMRSMK
jgi:hypothetical protein